MKLFLDDIREAPDGWVCVRDPHEAMDILTHGKVDEISFDHDLGEGVPTGYDVATWLEAQVIMGHLACPKYLNCHSANPVGRKRIMQVIENLERFQ